MTEADPGSCPSCGDTSGVHRAESTPRVETWSCSACGTQSAITVVNPGAFLRQLAEEVAARSLLRKVQALTEQAPRLTGS